MCKDGTAGSLKANSSSTLNVVECFHASISTIPGNGGKSVFAKRRFVYCWRKPTNGTSWENLGLMMTDDDGKLFNLQSFLTDKRVADAQLKVNKYDPESNKFVSKSWTFLGGTEDIICFQKYCGDEKLGKSTAKILYKDIISTCSFRINDQNHGELYATPFFVEDTYLLPFEKGFDYFIMFCPPDIIFRGFGAVSPSATAKPSATAALTIISNSSAIPDLKFLTEPLPLWLSNSYITGEDETLDVVAKKTGIPADQIKSQAGNQGKIPAAGQKFTSGTCLSIPVVTNNRFGFGRLFGLSKFNATVSPDKLVFNNVNKAPLDVPVLDVTLPVTLEEHLSSLAADTCMLDITWGKVIESSKPFFEASQKLTQIADIVDLMLRFPGYKGRTAWSQSARYTEKMTIDSTRLKDFNQVFIDSEKLSKDISNAAFTLQNPVLKEESGVLFPLCDKISALFKSQEFIDSLVQWRRFLLNATAQGSYPYLWDMQQIPMIFSVIEQAISLILLISAKKTGNEGTTVAQDFYSTVLEPFQLLLENIFNALDFHNNLSDELMTQISKSAIIGQKPAISNPDKVHADVPVLKADSVLTVLFKDILIQKVLAKSGGHLSNILRVGTQFRSSVILQNCEIKKTQFALRHFKIAVASIFITERSPEKLKKKLTEAYASFEQSNQIFVAQKTQIEADIKKSNAAIKATTGGAKFLEGAIASCYYFWSIYEFAGKLDSKKIPTLEQWLKMVSLVQSGWAISAGLGINDIVSEMQSLKKFQNVLLRKMGKDCRRNLRGGMALYKSGAELVEKVSGGIETIMMPIEIYKKCISLYDDWLAGDNVVATLRTTEAVIDVASFFLGPWGKAAGTLTHLGIEATIMIREAGRFGVQNTITSITESLNESGGLFGDNGGVLDKIVLRNKHKSLYSSEKYRLITSNTVLLVTPQSIRYEIDPMLTNAGRALRKLCGGLPYVNLDIIKAGAVFYKQGYSFEDIGYITMKIPKGDKHNRLSDFEKEYIKGFAEVGAFSAKDSLSSLAYAMSDDPANAKLRYRDPADDYYYTGGSQSNEKEVTFADPPTPKEYFLKNYGISI